MRDNGETKDCFQDEDKEGARKQVKTNPGKVTIYFLGVFLLLFGKILMAVSADVSIFTSKLTKCTTDRCPTALRAISRQ